MPLSRFIYILLLSLSSLISPTTNAEENKSPKNVTLPKFRPTQKTTTNNYGSEHEQCLRAHLLAYAKKKVTIKGEGFNHWGSRGRCSAGVLIYLGESGFLPPKTENPEHPGNPGFPQGWFYGDAIEFHDRAPTPRNKSKKLNLKDYQPGSGFLKDWGFRDITADFPDDRNCLPGSILVYRGIKKHAKQFQKTGKIKTKSDGASVGHVTICGDSKDKKGRNNIYYTDGMTRLPARKDRTLVAVYMPSKCIHCTSDNSFAASNKCIKRKTKGPR